MVAICLGHSRKILYSITWKMTVQTNQFFANSASILMCQDLRCNNISKMAVAKRWLSVSVQLYINLRIETNTRVLSI